MRCTPASLHVVVEPLSGACHLLTLAPCQVLLAEPHLCLQSAGGSHIPAQPCANPSHLTLRHRNRHVVLHSFQDVWKQKNIARCENFYCAGSSCSPFDLWTLFLPCWCLNGQDSIRRGFPFHHTCKQRCSISFSSFTKFYRCLFLPVVSKTSTTWKHRHGATKYDEITISLLPLGCNGKKKKKKKKEILVKKLHADNIIIIIIFTKIVKL